MDLRFQNAGSTLRLQPPGQTSLKRIPICYLEADLALLSQLLDGCNVLNWGQLSWAARNHTKQHNRVLPGCSSQESENERSRFAFGDAVTHRRFSNQLVRR